MDRVARVAFVIAGVFAFVMATLAHPPVLPGHPSDKLQHVLAFATLGVLSAYGFSDRPLVALFAVLTIYGGVIELVQAIPVLHRDSDILDLLADMVAAGSALWITRRIMAARPRPR